jgi:hypothetical protein
VLAAARQEAKAEKIHQVALQVAVPEHYGSGGYPPTRAMKRFADSLARQRGIKPPPGYKTSISICGAFLKEHAPKKAESETSGKLEPKSISPAQLLYATKIAQGKGLGRPNKISTACGASNKGRCFEDIPSIKLPNEMAKLAEHILASIPGHFDASRFQMRQMQPQYD